MPAESTPAGLKGHWTRPCSVFTKGVGAKQRQYVRGQIAVRNTSGQSLARGTVKVYLANASTADPSHDTLLKVLRLGVLHDGAEQPRAINIRVTEGIDLSGMWVVAVIAFDDGPDTRTVLSASGPLGTRPN